MEGPRKVLLLSTAELVDDRYLRSAGRYSYGAVFAPGFYPDLRDQVIGDFVDRYRAQFGTVPSALEAYAYDAGALVRYVLARGARSRGQVASQLANIKLVGLTGEIRFGPERARADDGLLYRVSRLSTGEYELRAIR